MPCARLHISIRNFQSKKACRLLWAFWLKKCGPRFLQNPRERWRLRTDAGYTGPAVHNNREIEKCYGFALYAPLSCQWNRNILLDGDHVFPSVALGRFDLPHVWWTP